MDRLHAKAWRYRKRRWAQPGSGFGARDYPGVAEGDSGDRTRGATRACGLASRRGRDFSHGFCERLPRDRAHGLAQHREPGARPRRQRREFPAIEPRARPPREQA